MLRGTREAENMTRINPAFLRPYVAVAGYYVIEREAAISRQYCSIKQLTVFYPAAYN
jgi:hypothetical protein